MFKLKSRFPILAIFQSKRDAVLRHSPAHRVVKAIFVTFLSLTWAMFLIFDAIVSDTRSPSTLLAMALLLYVSFYVLKEAYFTLRLPAAPTFQLRAHHLVILATLIAVSFLSARGF